jgi:ABC-type uncharacterized transport system permease subunit
VLSLVAWLLAVFALLVALKHPLRRPAAVLLPAAGLVRARGAAARPGDAPRRGAELGHPRPRHLSILAYSLLSLGAGLAVLFLFRERTSASAS